MLRKLHRSLPCARPNWPRAECGNQGLVLHIKGVQINGALYNPELTAWLHPKNRLAVARNFFETRCTVGPAGGMKSPWPMTRCGQYVRRGDYYLLCRTQLPFRQFSLRAIKDLLTKVYRYVERQSFHHCHH